MVSIPKKCHIEVDLAEPLIPPFATAPLRETAACLNEHLVRHLLKQERVGGRLHRETAAEDCGHPLARGLCVITTKPVDVDSDETQLLDVPVASAPRLAAMPCLTVLPFLIARGRCREQPVASPRRDCMQCHGVALCSDRPEERIHVTFSKAPPPPVRQARASDAVGVHPPVSRRVNLIVMVIVIVIVIVSVMK